MAVTRWIASRRLIRLMISSLVMAGAPIKGSDD
jgi:hypothetical protein